MNFIFVKVEAALLTDPENGELLKLKQDLEEVIELTRDLIKTQLADQKKSSYVEPTITGLTKAPATSTASGTSSRTSEPENNDDETEYYDEIEAALVAAENSVKTSRQWKIGDKCQAKWTEDGNYYDATIEGIADSGEVSVIFDAYQNRSTTSLSDLKERIVRNEVFPSVK